MKALLLANGDIKSYERFKALAADCGMVICCDGGIRHAGPLGVKPGYILGDFDSAAPALVEAYRQQGTILLTFQKEKDFTDTALAMTFALSNNATEIFILGAMGSRFDHTLANVHTLLEALNAGVPAFMLNENNTVCLMDGDLSLSGKKGDLLSLIPLTTEVTGISTQGVKYPLYGETLRVGASRGISNVFEGEEVKLHVESGVLIVMRACD